MRIGRRWPKAHSPYPSPTSGEEKLAVLIISLTQRGGPQLFLLGYFKTYGCAVFIFGLQQFFYHFVYVAYLYAIGALGFLFVLVSNEDTMASAFQMRTSKKQVGIAGYHLAHFYKYAHDLYVHFHGSWAVQYTA